jgi:hypothetical protein
MWSDISLNVDMKFDCKAMIQAFVRDITDISHYLTGHKAQQSINTDRRSEAPLSIAAKKLVQ